MKNRILFVFFLFILLFSFSTFSEDDNCPKPGNDSPDDNHSYAAGIVTQTDGLGHTAQVIILLNGYYQEMGGLLRKLSLSVNYCDGSEPINNTIPVLVLPSASLLHKINIASFKAIIEEYVRKGGTILVFDQQYGSHVDNIVPIPAAASLKSYGFREDQSCFNGSLYFKDRHPVLSSLTNEKVNGTVDGYFSAYPSSSTVLLRRTSNLEPALIYYPYGNGTVILTSLYTDWAYAHSQASAEELRLVRDLITFARNPNLPIPMFDVAASPTPAISLLVKVKNSSEGDASKAKILVKSADWKTVLFSMESAVTLAKDAEAEIAVSFTLPAIAPAQYGICHS